MQGAILMATPLIFNSKEKIVVNQVDLQQIQLKFLRALYNMQPPSMKVGCTIRSRSWIIRPPTDFGLFYANGLTQ